MYILKYVSYIISNYFGSYVFMRFFCKLKVIISILIVVYTLGDIIIIIVIKNGVVCTDIYIIENYTIDKFELNLRKSSNCT